ncbi:MAG TPA: type II secretion system protein [Gaiellaceae bacterium]|nr:type II secretion system protein [Gaiellaceae bacterium]
MLRALGQRLGREESGMTLIELLIVTTILGILTSISVPSYLGFRDKADQQAASANIYAITPDIEWYAFDNHANQNTSKDPDWNGSDAPGTGTNADEEYSDTWTGTGHDFMSLLQSKYDPSIVVANYYWDPAGWTPPTGSTTSNDYCVYTLVGTYYAAKHGPGGAITSGQTMHLGANGDCYAS